MIRVSLVALLILGLASCDVVPTGGGADVPAGYEPFFSPAEHNFRFGSAPSGDPVRRGQRSERYEMRDGDCGGSDCGNPRYRSEIRIQEQINDARVGKDIWYGWSFLNFNVPAYERDESLRLVFGQWTMGGEASPVIRLIQLGRDEGHWDTCDPAICSGPEKARGDVVIQLEDMRRTSDWGKGENNGYVCRLFDIAANRGKWVDLTMNTNFSKGRDGYLKIWVNGALKCDYKGPIVAGRSLLESTQPEHRRGAFASFTERWERANGTQTKPTVIVYYDEFTSGTSRAAVDITLRQRAGLPPID